MDHLPPEALALHEAHVAVASELDEAERSWMDPARWFLEPVEEGRADFFPAFREHLDALPRSAEEQVAVVLCGALSWHGLDHLEPQLADLAAQCESRGDWLLCVPSFSYLLQLEELVRRLDPPSPPPGVDPLKGGEIVSTEKVRGLKQRLEAAKALPGVPGLWGTDISRTHPLRHQGRVVLCTSGRSLNRSPEQLNVWLRCDLPTGDQLRTQQRGPGVDLLLHGSPPHLQHLDADLEEAGYTVALGSCTELPTCVHQLDVQDVRDGELSRLSVLDGELKVQAVGELQFEHVRPGDHGTIATRLELRRFESRNDEAHWEDIEKPARDGDSIFYFVGRTLETVTGRGLFRRILRSPKARVRVLISNPRLLRESALALSNQRPRGTNSARPKIIHTSVEAILGPRGQVEVDADSAESSLLSLDEQASGLSEGQRRRLDVRVSHTLVPFGAVVRRVLSPSAKAERGMMVVRLLPPQASSFKQPSPHLRLTQRKDDALYSHYLLLIKGLLAEAWPLELGAWSTEESTDLLPFTQVNRRRLSVENAIERPQDAVSPSTIVEGDASRSFEDERAKAFFAQMAPRMCQIRISGQATGVGFLVGPGTVLTCHHVVQEVVSGALGPDEVEVRFPGDRRRRKGEVKVRASSPPSLEDRNPVGEKQEPDDDFLDYAVLELPGRRDAERVQGAGQRGYIEVSSAGVPAVGRPVAFLSFSDDASSPKLTLGEITHANESSTRLRYALESDGIPSGSPCFDEQLSLVAVHHSGRPGVVDPQTHEAVPTVAIRRRLPESLVRPESTAKDSASSPKEGSALTQLFEFLVDAFQPTELERIIRFEHTEVANDLSWTNDMKTLAFKVIDALGKRGGAELEDFFDSIERERPKRSEELAKLRVMFDYTR